ncbi:ATP-dependent DNA ligase [Streptomyces bauhiniae]|uniref:ATP-dependent DNA ligase n=1 Tax=Streptomyces bauhiniae TaxID=2340725 RepID=UPI0035D97A27
MSHETPQSLESDGYRGLIFTASTAVDSVQIQSRRGALLQTRFPDLVRAAAALPDGLVLDGELVVWDAGHVSFEAVQRRAAAGSRSAGQLAKQFPTHFIAFDLLQVDGEELLTTRYGERRDLLARPFAEHGIGPPWTLCPETEDVRVAQEWLSTWTDVLGVEGIVVRDRRQRYVPGARGWYKIRRRDTTEAVVGAVTGTMEHPQTLVLGRYDEEGVLRAVARSTPLHPDRGRHVGAWLTPGPARTCLGWRAVHGVVALAAGRPAR